MCNKYFSFLTNFQINKMIFIRFDDGMLEVFGVYSSFHIAQMQVSLSEPMRLGQARNVMVIFQVNLP